MNCLSVVLVFTFNIILLFGDDVDIGEKFMVFCCCCVHLIFSSRVLLYLVMFGCFQKLHMYCKMWMLITVHDIVTPIIR